MSRQGDNMSEDHGADDIFELTTEMTSGENISTNGRESTPPSDSLAGPFSLIRDRFPMTRSGKIVPLLYHRFRWSLDHRIFRHQTSKR